MTDKISIAIGIAFLLLGVIACGSNQGDVTDLALQQTQVALQQTQVAIQQTQAALAKNPTLTPSLLFTAMPPTGPTVTPGPQINVSIYSCDTGTDVLNGMGEVTNGYVLVQNVGGVAVADIRVELRANDEDRVHPDKVYTIQNLPGGHQIPLKLTVDTENDIVTELDAVVEAAGMSGTATKGDCISRITDRETVDAMGILFKVVEIPAR